ncbi:MAG: hypothetical protein KJN59_04170 [Bacteroidia bacterium]|nr:hypothetical protein [Bacteroidia bacterium]
MDFRKLIEQLHRRNVFKATLAYLAVAWVVVQIASIVLPTFDAPDYALKIVIYLLVLGLIFWVIFSWIYDLTPQGFRKTSEVEIDEETIRLTNRRLNNVIVGSIVLAVILLISVSFWAGSKWSSGEFSGRNYRVAILPMTDLTQTNDSVYFSSGLTDAFITELSKVDQFTILHQSSSKKFTPDVSAANLLILEQLKQIDYFISGTIERRVNTIEVKLELKEAIDSDEVIWSKKYSKDITQVKSLFAEAVVDISAEMEIDVDIENNLQLTKIRQVRPETYELYLKGKYYLGKSTPAEFQKGMAFLQQAIDQNPADPDAYAGLAEGYITLGHGPDPPPDVFPKALAAAKRAIQLDSLNAEGWAALAHYHTYFGMDWKLAEYAFEKADLLNPNMAYNHYHRSWYLVLFGRMNEAIEEHKRAQELDPFTPMHTAFLAEIYRMVGEYDKGLAELDKVRHMDDNYAIEKVIRGLIYVDQGREEEGFKLLRQAYSILPVWRYWGYGMALTRRSANFDEAKAVISELEAAPPSGFVNLCLGMINAELGQNDEAIKWLAKENRHGWYPWIRIYINNEGVRKDPRFLELISDMNLPYPAPLKYDPE